MVLHLHMVEHSETAHHPTQHLMSIPVQPQLQLDWPDSANPLSDPIFYPTGPTVPIMPTTVVHLSAAAHEAWMGGVERSRHSADASSPLYYQFCWALITAPASVEHEMEASTDLKLMCNQFTN